MATFMCDYGEFDETKTDRKKIDMGYWVPCRTCQESFGDSVIQGAIAATASVPTAKASMAVLRPMGVAGAFSADCNFGRCEGAT